MWFQSGRAGEKYSSVGSSGLSNYAHAREAQAATLFDEILDIADDARNDWMEKRSAEGEQVGWQENGEAIRRSQLRIDARKWVAGKLRPKKYGDKLDVERGGAVRFDRIETVIIDPKHQRPVG